MVEANLSSVSVKDFVAQYDEQSQLFKDFLNNIGIPGLQTTSHFVARLVERFGAEDLRVICDRIRESAALAIRHDRERSQIGQSIVVVGGRTAVNPCLITLFNTDSPSSPKGRKKIFCGKQIVRRPRQYLRLHPGSVLRSRKEA